MISSRDVWQLQYKCNKIRVRQYSHCQMAETKLSSVQKKGIVMTLGLDYSTTSLLADMMGSEMELMTTLNLVQMRQKVSTLVLCLVEMKSMELQITKAIKSAQKMAP